MNNTNTEPKANLPLEAGMRVRLVRDVERFPHCIVRKGATGTYLGHRMGVSAVKLDEKVEGLEEWQNDLLWYDEDEDAPSTTGIVEDDVEVI